MEGINAARNILLFPKKRLITELQNQKNMVNFLKKHLKSLFISIFNSINFVQKIFPLVPNDLIFSFYIQGFKLVLAIYTLKGNETTKQIVIIMKPFLIFFIKVAILFQLKI